MGLSGKKVLVTGGNGFLGRYVVNGLIKSGVRDIIAPRRHECDLTRESNVEKLIGETRPDIIIHLAAVVGGIGANQAQPGKFLYDNISMGTLLLEHARRNDVEKFVTLGTICAYPKFTPVPFKEEHLWNGYPEETNAPYGLAKKMLLVQGQAYRSQYGFNSIYLLPVNLYGPGDNFDPSSSHVIPALVRKCFEAIDNGQSKIVCWGDGSPTREFLYVEDCARAILLATENYDGDEPVNIGTGKEITIKDLAEKIAVATGFDGEIVWDTEKPNGQPRRCLDTSRAWEYFQFKAEIDFTEGLQRTVDWYREANCLQASFSK